ncbi:MAG: hypothetical protein JXM79_15565, partial [Sedimentisphaerales bacterium]|nr:hypothetical protein [Sedimentisphaerales bacterium]
MKLSNGLIIILFLLGLFYPANGQAIYQNSGALKAKNGLRKSTEVPFKRGVNLTNWLQGSNVREIQFTKFTKQDFINI